jgi:hypothetical protein
VWRREGGPELKQVSIGELRRNLTTEKMRELIPCEVTSDGVVVAMLLDYDAQRDALRTVPVVGRVPSYRGMLSKERQASPKGFNA